MLTKKFKEDYTILPTSTRNQLNRCINLKVGKDITVTGHNQLVEQDYDFYSQIKVRLFEK